MRQQVGLWKHVDMRDVAIEVIKEYYIPEKDAYALRIMWWNIGECHAPWSMAIGQRITIPAGDWGSKWLPYKYLGTRDRWGREI